MNKFKTKNVLLLEKNLLREVDDFNISTTSPNEGKMYINFTLGELEPIQCGLHATNNDFKKLKDWMESIAMGAPLVSVILGSGNCITCKTTNISDSKVNKTYRYLDELFSSPIYLLSIKLETGDTYTAILKIKHFINQLYMALMIYGERRLQNLKKHWYPYTEKYNHSENYKTWINKNPCWHQSLLQSTLIEWYLQSQECFVKKTPQFKVEVDYVYIVTMWADYGCSIFWNNGISIGEITELSIFNLNFDFSDIKGLNEWYDEFIRLADDYREIYTTTEEKKDAILEKIRQWHINGFKFAQEIRKRLPTNVILIYEQSWDVAIGQLYFSRDYGRIILDPRKIKN